MAENSEGGSSESASRLCPESRSRHGSAVAWFLSLAVLLAPRTASTAPKEQEPTAWFGIRPEFAIQPWAIPATVHLLRVDAGVGVRVDDSVVLAFATAVGPALWFNEPTTVYPSTDPNHALHIEGGFFAGRPYSLRNGTFLVGLRLGAELVLIWSPETANPQPFSPLIPATVPLIWEFGDGPGRFRLSVEPGVVFPIPVPTLAISIGIAP